MKRENIKTFYGVSAGRKMIMAITGVIVFGFIIIHLLGNLLIFTGPQKLNSYSAFLHDRENFLWLFRGVLSLSVFGHIISAWALTRANYRARKDKYVMRKYSATTYAARTMVVGGILIFAFVVFHLLHLSIGVLPFSATHIDPGDVYSRVVTGFMNPLVSGVYIVAMIVLGFHLFHGLASVFLSLGISSPNWNKVPRVFAIVFSAFVAMSGISIPVSVLLGLVQLI